jgi:phosphorylcholine metabolism protein LicD
MESESSKEMAFKNCLTDMKNILDSIGQQFFLACGTFLGQHREGKFIPYDDDIDIGVMNDSVKEELVASIVSSGVFTVLEDFGKDNESKKYKFLHQNGTKIDIFLHYKVESDRFYYATFLDFVDGVPTKMENGFHKWLNHVRGFSQVEFYDNHYLAPKNAKEYLVETYGDDYMTPKKYSYKEGLLKKYFKNKD